MHALATLLGSLIDYAGLFPPAKLDMPHAVRNHATHLHGPHRALLGRFVVPLARLPEFSAAHAALPTAQQAGWQLSALAGPDPRADAAAIHVFNSTARGARIVSIETKAAAPGEVAALVAPFSRELEVWVELAPTAPKLPALFDALAATGRGAKLRTGGITPEVFPAPAAVLRFLRECRRTAVVAKATAGLHHPLRGDFALTYEAGATHGRMFGFLNLLLAAALTHAGDDDTAILALLDDSDFASFATAPAALSWRGHRFTTAQIATVRRTLLRSFGSCSFTEPVEGLQALRWL